MKVQLDLVGPSTLIGMSFGHFATISVGEPPGLGFSLALFLASSVWYVLAARYLYNKDEI